MKSLITIATLSIISVCSTYASVGSVLRDAKVPELVERAVPTLKFENGDKNWSGGMYSSAYIGTSAFDSNTIYSIYSSGQKLSAADTAPAILRLIAKEFKLPIDHPSSIWPKKTPSGLSAEDYAMAFLNSYPSGDRQKGGDYVTVEVTKVGDMRYAISVTYVCVQNE